MSEPFYTRDGVALYLADMRELLLTLPDAGIDSVVCDPPY